MELTEQEKDELLRLKSSFPFRLCFVAKNENETLYIAKPTRHLAHSYARKGYFVVEAK